MLAYYFRKFLRLFYDPAVSITSAFLVAGLLMWLGISGLESMRVKNRIRECADAIGKEYKISPSRVTFLRENEYVFQAQGRKIQALCVQPWKTPTEIELD